ncbi:MAG TPA: IMP dehydrogenase, partial [Saprospiraceae bacterium]|nr:IMP dehydrogenase [Saprospiraceae bacterium]
MEFNLKSKKELFTDALTFDDVLLVPGYSNVLPRDVDISTLISRNIRIHVPMVSAAMDTVTEKDTAIAIAREGGIGIIHKNMIIQAQADQVRAVKRSESGMIQDPITLSPEATVGEAQQLMRQHKIGGIPITNPQGILVGMLTNRDLRFEARGDRKVSELMTAAPLITAPVGTTLEQAKMILQKHKIEKLPVVDAKQKLTGLITYRDLMKLEDFPNSSKDHRGRLRVGAAVGIAADTHDRVDALVHEDVDVIVVDTAHGHSEGVLNMVREIRKRHRDLEIIGGNVATAEGAKALKEAGVD